ncbi:hypothetical protein QZH41_012430 [Actinostola sp. cb2023]|nr:hypothetical protein QZH41_012430 [Actinostola sp. cb2023]
MRLEKCYFCSSTVYPGHGISFVRNDCKDNTFEFEKKRNVPVKYNRELWSNTVRAMKRIEEIKQKRQNLHIKNRLKPDKQLAKEVDKKEVLQNINLITEPGN